MRLERAFLRDSMILVTVAAVVAVALGRRRESRATERDVGRLFAAARERPARDRTGDTVADLPAPVRRYFDTVFEDGPPPGGAVRVEQEGTLRLGGPDSPWEPFTATHHATTRCPGFVWDATVGVLPGMSVRVRDSFVGGAGAARVTLFGALPVAGAASSPELNEAELQRYLAEAVWYPTTLLPGNGVTWEPVDDRTARATLACGETTASLDFHFSSADGEGLEVERVHTDRRYRRVDGEFEPTPWTGLWRDYEVVAGVRVPTEGEVVWHRPEGELHAWRGRVKGIERQPLP